MDEELTQDEKRILKTIVSNKSVNDNIDLILSKFELTRDKAANKLYVLWKKGYIDLKRSRKISSYLQYLLDIEAFQLHVTTLLLLITLLTVFFVSDPPLVYLRYILGSLFVLYLPGYSLIEALYPRGDELDALERLALSIGLSLALVPLVGLILNYTPWGIRLIPIAISLSILTEALMVVASYRKYQYFRIIG